ncbi:alpha/beta fold hydrolase [Streptomyces cyaneofuscatus]|uniref:alpha/beta fold hydrolase n=1 Tax=Streptomyces cyaneofuscatus TaxID=66883 RepID=UPI003805D277
MRTERVPHAGTTLDVIVSGEVRGARPVVLFANAVGMENELVAGLAKALDALDVTLVSWELRGSPGPSVTPMVSLREHTEDAVAIADALGLARVHVAGWCTGASVALFAALRMEDRAMSYTSVDGAFLFSGTPGARLGNAVFDMCADIAEAPGRAARFLDVVRPRGNEAEVLGVPDAEFTRMLTQPYRHGVEELTRFALGIRATNDYDPAEAFAGLQAPALFLAREDDQMVGHRNSREAAGRVAGAQIVVEPVGGHYALFTDPARSARTIAAFVHGVPVPPDLDVVR